VSVDASVPVSLPASTGAAPALHCSTVPLSSILIAAAANVAASQYASWQSPFCFDVEQ